MACLARPSSFAGLSRLRTQSRIAAAHLTEFHARFLDALSVKAMVEGVIPE
jgi:hypothetical protein